MNWRFLINGCQTLEVLTSGNKSRAFGVMASFLFRDGCLHVRGYSSTGAAYKRVSSKNDSTVLL